MTGCGETKACRLCLIMDSELISINMQLENSMRSILGQNITYESGLPKYACNDCSELLRRLNEFREKCLVAQTVLYHILKTAGQVTGTEIRNLNRKRLKLDNQLTPFQEKIPQEITSTEEMQQEITPTEKILVEDRPSGRLTMKMELETMEESESENEALEEESAVFLDASMRFKSKPEMKAKKSTKKEVKADPKLLCTKCRIQFSTEAAWRRHIDDGHIVHKEVKPTTKKKQVPNNYMQTLQNAIAAVKNKEMGQREASRFFKIPKSTLQGRLKSDSLRTKRGPPPIFNEEEEGVLVDFVIREGSLKPRAVLAEAAALTKQLNREKFFRSGAPGHTWYNNFLRRHPELKQYSKRSR